MKQTVLRNYARLIARMGVNIQKGQDVIIRCQLDQPRFVELLVDECYKAGAGYVKVEFHHDPLYTFPWFIEQDAKVKHADTIYFVKRTKGRGFDYPQYRLWGRDFKRLKHMLRHNNVYLGVHGSYYGDIPKIQYSKMFRAHYLRSSIEHMQGLADAGYTDDFTMGFADQAGFRLQTSRAVRWINPITMQLTNLTLHPLLIMDNTLSQANYMNLTEDEAYFLCERLIEKVHMHHGDLCLLWHNSNINGSTYHASLYEKIINCI